MNIGNAMTSGSPWKHILKFAMPVLAGSLLQQLYNTVDTIIVGNFASEAALSAVGTTGSFAFFLMAIAIGFSAGNGVLVAQHYGAGDEKQVRENASTGILLILGIGVFVTIAGIAIARPAFKYFIAVPEDILDLTLKYFIVFSFGLVFQYGYNIFSSILRAVGDSAATLYFLLISSVANILLDLLFVAVFHWGVVGAAVATDIAQLISFLAAYIYMVKKYPVFRFKFKDFTWSTALALKTIKFGFPISLQMIIVSLGLTMIQRFVNSFGQVMTASFTVGNRIEMYMNLPCNALQTTLATYTGQNVGAKKMDRVRTGARQTILISVLMTLVISACVYFLSGKIIHLFGLSSEAAGYCTSHLRTIAIINIVLSLYIPLFGLYQGTGHPIVPTFVATCALGIRVVIVSLLHKSDFLGYRILWWNGLFGFGIGFIITWTYYLSGRWDNMGERSLKGRKIVSLVFKEIVFIAAVLGTVLSAYAGRHSFMGGRTVFMYFTIQSNIALAIICAIGFVLLVKGKKVSKGCYIVKFVGTVSITLTGVVFCVVLAPTMGKAAWNFQNILTHVVVPVISVADFFVSCTESDIKKRNVFFVTLPPLLYAIYAGIGYVCNWQFSEGINYPYFFLNWGSPAGAAKFIKEFPFMGCIWWILALLAFLVGIGFLYLGILNKIKKNSVKELDA